MKFRENLPTRNLPTEKQTQGRSDTTRLSSLEKELG
jgi:hypothetical protein